MLETRVIIVICLYKKKSPRRLLRGIVVWFFHILCLRVRLWLATSLLGLGVLKLACLEGLLRSKLVRHRAILIDSVAFVLKSKIACFWDTETLWWWFCIMLWMNDIINGLLYIIYIHSYIQLPDICVILPKIMWKLLRKKKFSFISIWYNKYICSIYTYMNNTYIYIHIYI